MYMNDFELFFKNLKQLKTLLKTIRMNSKDMEIEFAIEK